MQAIERCPSSSKYSQASFVDEDRIQLGGGASASLYDVRNGSLTSVASLSQADRNAISIPQPIGTPRLELPNGMTLGSGAINVGDDPVAT